MCSFKIISEFPAEILNPLPFLIPFAVPKEDVQRRTRSSGGRLASLLSRAGFLARNEDFSLGT